MKLRMLVIWWLALLLGVNSELFSSSVGHITRVTRTTERLLRRQRRYLSFPTGANLVLSAILVKPLLQKQPKGWNMLAECDVPFPLPNDTRIIFKDQFYNKIRTRQRRQVYTLLEEALTRAGLDGNSCIKQLICQTQDYALATKKDGNKSLVRDILSAIFRIPEDEEEENSFCESWMRMDDCELPLFSYIIGSLKNPF